ncbi:MAG: hypothetical protein J6Y48_10525 [Clostridia bacterium]|nr:hypothetical protein [Clostridia bacterium]
MAAIKYIKRTVALDGNSISEQLPASFFNSEQTAHTFIIAATRGGEPLTLSGAVSATFLNANDAVVPVTGSIVDGAAVVTLSNECYALSGRFTLTIDVAGATVYECQSRIKRRSSGTAYDPTGEISVAELADEIAEMRTATAAANTAAAAADTARAGIQSDLQFSRDVMASDTIIKNDLTWVQGTINAATGANIQLDTRIRTGFLSAEPAIYAVTAKTGYSFAVYAYTSRNVNAYHGHWDGEGYDSVALTDVWHDGTCFIYATNKNGYALRLVARKNDDSDITPADAANAIEIKYTANLLEKDFAQFRGTIAGSELLSGYTDYGYYDLSAISSSDMPTGFSGNGVMVVYPIAGTNGGAIYQIIINSSWQTWMRYILSGNASAWNYGVGSPKNKWYVFGDSISAGYYSMTQAQAQAAGLTFTYNSPVTTETGEATGSVWDRTLKHNYWGYANAWSMHRDLVGMAYPGQGYFRTAGNSQNGVYVVTHNDFSDAGLITVAWGFNDWHYNMARGNHDLIDASTPYPGENYDTTQITTVNQAIWFCLGELIRQAPNAKIVVQTPMNGWAYGGDFASNWGIGTEMSSSGKLADIHDDIVYWANYYGLQVLEMTYNNSAVNRRNIKDALIDGSHPSDAAHQQLGRHVAAALMYT